MTKCPSNCSPRNKPSRVRRGRGEGRSPLAPVSLLVPTDQPSSPPPRAPSLPNNNNNNNNANPSAEHEVNLTKFVNTATTAVRPPVRGVSPAHLQALWQGLTALHTHTQPAGRCPADTQRLLASTQSFLRKMRMHRARHAHFVPSCAGCIGTFAIKRVGEVQLKLAQLKGDGARIAACYGALHELEKN